MFSHRCSLLLFTLMWFCDFCDFQQTRKQQLENNIVNVLEHMSRVSLSLYSQSSFFFNKKLKKRIGKEEVRILLRGLFLLLSPTFVTKCLTSSLKNEFFFLWFSAMKTFCTFESSNSGCCFFAMFLHRYNIYCCGSCSIFALFLLII